MCAVQVVFFNIAVLDDWLDGKDNVVAVLIIAGNLDGEIDDMS